MTAPQSAIESAIVEIADDLVNENERGTMLIAESNADGWGLDDYREPKTLRSSDSECVFRATITLDGDQLDNKPFNGDQITADVAATLNRDGDSRVLDEDYEIHSIEMNYE